MSQIALGLDLDHLSLSRGNNPEKIHLVVEAKEQSSPNISNKLSLLLSDNSLLETFELESWREEVHVPKLGRNGTERGATSTTQTNTSQALITQSSCNSMNYRNTA